VSAAPLLGGVELGGTKCIGTIGTGPDDIRMRIEVPTGADPAVTLERLETILRNGIALHGRPVALGLACFGPLEPDVQAAGFGRIGRTAKPGWSHTPIRARFAHAFDLPVVLDTDVNGAVLAEARWGAAQGLADVAYVTVGTGIGVGLLVNGRLVHGFAHPELGHIRVARRPEDAFAGVCPFHGDCVEGLAAGPAIAARAARAAPELPDEHPAFTSALHALGQLLHTIVLATAPRRIIVGGGVLHDRPALIGALRRELAGSLAGYGEPPGGFDAYVLAPALGAAAGPLGALALAAG